LGPRHANGHPEGPPFEHDGPRRRRRGAEGRWAR
jgi:hypothetical protein